MASNAKNLSELLNTDSTITTSDIADDAVTGTKLANDINIAGDLTVTGNDINTNASMLLKPGGTEIVNINQQGDVLVKGQGSNRAALILRAGSNSANSQIQLGDQASDSSGRIMYDHSDDTMRFNTNGTERFRVSASGIHLGGIGAANAFDDYEEGTWTPDIRNADNANTFSNELGRYVKIGSVVYIYFYSDNGNTGGGGGLQVRGLPFTYTSNDYIFGARGMAGVNNSSNSTRRNLIVNFNSAGTDTALLYYGGTFLSDTLTYVSGFAVYKTDS